MRAIFGGEPVSREDQGEPCDPADGCVPSELTDIPWPDPGALEQFQLRDAVTRAVPGRTSGSSARERIIRGTRAPPWPPRSCRRTRLLIDAIAPTYSARESSAPCRDGNEHFRRVGVRVHERLDALAAVRRVRPAVQHQRIYVADEPANHVVAVELSR